MIRLWKYVSRQGFKETMSLSEQKKLILTNQVSLLLFLVLLMLMTAVSFLSDKVNIVSFFVVLLILVIPVLNHYGLYRLTSFLMSTIFPINAMIFSTVAKIQIAEMGSMDIVYHMTPRFLLLGGLILPLILIDVRHKWFLIVAIIINLTCVLSYDYICNSLGVGIGDLHVTFEKSYLITPLMLLPWVLILVGFLFLQSINHKYEGKILTLNNDLHVKNNQLFQQNEEIQSQRDEISSQRDEITAQRDSLAKQKEHIEFIHEEQTSSIRYALSIQQAMLPSLKILNDSGLEYFMFFKPRDIVSGDFYWVDHQENIIIVAVADCTGHGVPGAFMSMLGIAFLKEIVMKEHITQPDQVLEKLRKEIVRSLKQESASSQSDGMDMAICTINLETLELQFAGANNPLYIVTGCSSLVTGEVNQQPATSNQQLIELKPDKMPIGIYVRMEDFKMLTHQLRKGDCIYLFSDGFADQFGGPSGKKLKYKQLKELLLANSQRPTTIQKELLDKFYAEWKGGFKQVDDLTVLGIKI